MTEIPKVLTPQLREQLNTISTATLAHQLQMRGIRGSFFSGLKPTHPEMRMVGRARTLRYVALREDQIPRFQRGVNAQKRAAEGIEPGDVIVTGTPTGAGVRFDPPIWLKAGDVLIQRGTSHAWSNRTEQPCCIAFVLIDAEPA